jgi:SAM-dependent methyltransferase|tara:strand:+ start:2275 stop:2991 length:717 start_codon:yes stop_codon:yes gene_type:complete
MSSWETNNDQSKLLSLLYGIDVTQYKTEDELNKRLSELKEEKTSIIKNMIIPNILKNYDISLDKCSVIEIGPGAGIMSNWLLPKIEHLYCIDISKSILNYCKEQHTKYNNVSYNLIEKLEFPNLKDIDFVYSQSVFIHLSILDFYLYFKELYKVLKPNGLIYIDIIDCDVDEFTLQEDEFQRQLQLLKQGYTTGVKTLYHVNSGKVLNQVAKELGYELVWSQGSIFNPANVGLIYKKI